MSWLARLFGAGGAVAAQDLPADALFIDVRSEGEYAAGHLQGALNLPLSRIDAEIGRHVRDLQAPLVLYCRSGARSGRACSILGAMGYARAHNGRGIDALAAALNRQIVRGRR